MKWSGCNRHAQLLNISIVNFIKSPKKWSGQNRTSRTGSYAYDGHMYGAQSVTSYLSMHRCLTVLQSENNSGIDLNGPVKLGSHSIRKELLCMVEHFLNVLLCAALETIPGTHWKTGTCRDLKKHKYSTCQCSVLLLA